MGFPFDSGVSYRPGARFGPQHVRQSSKLLRPYHPPLDVHPFHAQQVADAGDVGINPFSIDDAVATVERAADELREPGSTLLSVGGDHTIALPLLRSVARTHGPVAVLHFDAHLDTWDTYFGAPYTHGTLLRRASEEGLIDRIILIALLATSALGVGAAFWRASGRESDGLGAFGLAGLAACISAVLVLYRIIQEPGFDEFSTVKIGAPLALGVLGVYAFAAAISLRQEARAEPEPAPAG